MRISAAALANSSPSSTVLSPTAPSNLAFADKATALHSVPHGWASHRALWPKRSTTVFTERSPHPDLALGRNSVFLFWLAHATPHHHHQKLHHARGRPFADLGFGKYVTPRQHRQVFT